MSGRLLATLVWSASGVGVVSGIERLGSRCPTRSWAGQQVKPDEFGGALQILSNGLGRILPPPRPLAWTLRHFQAGNLFGALPRKLMNCQPLQVPLQFAV